MDLVIVLEQLAITDGDMSPAPDLSSYAKMKATWRNPAIPIPTLAVCQAEYDAYLAEVALVAYQGERAAAYPAIGDQLDAIWKQFNQDRLDDKALIQEADDLLGAILAVKNAHPKPVA